MRVVGTLTTMPHRYPMLLRTLKCLQYQSYKLDTIYLGIPKVSKRLNIVYPPIPPEIQELCTIVELPEDYGPISKIMGAFLSLNMNENVFMISFDDDVIYPPDLVTKMVFYASKKEAIGSSGFLIGAGYPFYGSMVNTYSSKTWDINRILNIHLHENREVDILCGFSAIMYHRSFFADDFLSFITKHFLSDKDLFLNDDVTISGYLSYKGIKRRLIDVLGPLTIEDAKNIFPHLDPIILAAAGATALEEYNPTSNISYDKIKFLQRFASAIDQSKKIGFFAADVPVSYSESVLYKIFILVILLIIFIFLVYMMILNIKVF